MTFSSSTNKRKKIDMTFPKACLIIALIQFLEYAILQELTKFFILWTKALNQSDFCQVGDKSIYFGGWELRITSTLNLLAGFWKFPLELTRRFRVIPRSLSMKMCNLWSSYLYFTHARTCSHSSCARKIPSQTN